MTVRYLVTLHQQLRGAFLPLVTESNVAPLGSSLLCLASTSLQGKREAAIGGLTRYDVW